MRVLPILADQTASQSHGIGIGDRVTDEPLAHQKPAVQRQRRIGDPHRVEDR
jgi:hypothetical protein